MSRLIAPRVLGRSLTQFKTKSFGQIRYQSSSSLVKEVESFENFTKLTKDSKLSVIDFYADWCGPCKLMSPILEKFLLKYSDETQFLKIDVDRQQDIAQEFGVTAMPTFMLFKNGEGIGKIVGANPKGLQLAIEQYK